MKIFRPKVISNVNLHRVTVPPAATDLIRHRRWQWIGHVLRKESTDDGKIALTWHASTGGRKRGKPTVTWRRMVEKEQNQFHWRSCGGSCISGEEKSRMEQLYQCPMRPDTWRKKEQ